MALPSDLQLFSKCEPDDIQSHFNMDILEINFFYKGARRKYRGGGRIRRA